ENDRPGVGLGMVGQDGVMSGRVVAAHYPRTWGGLHADGLGVDGHVTLGVNPYRGAQAPDKGPPGAIGLGAQGRTVLPERQVPGLLGRHFEFAVDFVLVVMESQLLEVGVGTLQGLGLFDREIGRQAVLPELMLALDLALGL